MEPFGRCKLEWLRTFLEPPHGIPSHDYAITLNREQGRMERWECWAISPPSCLEYLLADRDCPYLRSVVKVVGGREHCLLKIPPSQKRLPRRAFLRLRRQQNLPRGLPTFQLPVGLRRFRQGQG